MRCSRHFLIACLLLLPFLGQGQVRPWLATLLTPERPACCRDGHYCPLSKEHQATPHFFSLPDATQKIEGETIGAIEEAFLMTGSLPYGLRLEVGHFFTEFGQLNPQHSDQRDWVDQPLINSRLFSGEGRRHTGFRASWLLPASLFSQLHFCI